MHEDCFFRRDYLYPTEAQGPVADPEALPKGGFSHGLQIITHAGDYEFESLY